MKNADPLSLHSIDAEHAVLGAVLLDFGKCLNSIREIIGEHDFYSSSSRLIFITFLNLTEESIPIDSLTVASRLQDDGTLQSAGGHVFIAALLDSCPSSANATHYAKIVKEKSVRRAIVAGAKDVSEAASERGGSTEDITKAAIKKFQSIDIPRPVTTSTSADVLLDLERNIDAGVTGLDPCYELLGRTVRRIAPGRLYVAGGYTSVGKSFWAGDLISRLYRQGNPGIAVFSTEMSTQQYMLRFLSNDSEIPSYCIEDNLPLQIHQYNRLIAAKDRFRAANLYLYDNLYRYGDIEKTATKLKAKNGLDIVVIDYVQNLWVDGSSIYERMAKIAPQLLVMAKEMEVTVIVLSQVSNEAAKGEANGIIGFKGAGEIAAAADVAIWLERYKNDTNLLKVTVRKNRHGRVGHGYLRYAPDYTRLLDEDDRG